MTASPQKAPAPQPRATVALLIGIVVAPFVTTGQTPEALAHSYAVCVGLGIIASAWLDHRRNLRNLVRADLMAIASLYFLTLFEFLLPQSDFNDLVGLEETRAALDACLLGFAG